MLTTPCGTTALIADDFNASAPGAQWYPYAHGGTTTVQTGGDLVVTLPATTMTGAQYGGYDSSWYYDLRGDRAYVEVKQTVSTATNAQTQLEILAASGDQLFVSEEAGFLTADTYIGTTTTTLATIPYNPVTHRWWQIREAAGTVYFETSQDGTSFTHFAMTPTPASMALVNVVLEAGSYQVENGAGQAQFDNLNGGVAGGRWCGASTLRDNFNSGVIGDQWHASYTGGGCTLMESAGGVVVSLSPGGLQDCALVSASGFDLTGDAVFTAITTSPKTSGGTFSYLRASALNGDNVEVAQIDGTMNCAQNVGGVFSTTCSVAFDPMTHKFWQLVESGGMLSFQTSTDGASWTNLVTETSPISLVGVNLGVGAGTNNAVSSPGTATFSTFDQLPP